MEQSARTSVSARANGVRPEPGSSVSARANGVRPKPGESAGLTCPRCGAGTLITGARGWGCSRWRDGCGFVVWFVTQGRKLTAVQLRDLVTKGKTRKATFDGGDGRLVLAPAISGGVRFEPG